MCVIEYVTPEILIGGGSQLRISGPSMTLTAIAFNSAESAEIHQELVLRSVRQTGNVAEGALGDDSYLFTADAEGIGSILGFLLRPYVVQLHTTLPQGGAPLVSPEDLKALAVTARASLASP